MVYYICNIHLLPENSVSVYVRNYIPDFLWEMSCYFISINFTHKITKRYIVVTGIYTFFVGLVFELFQLFNIVRGTFDFVDIVDYMLAAIISCIIEKKWGNKYEKN